MSLLRSSVNDPQKYDLTNLAKVGWKIAAAQFSDCYAVADKFHQGDVEALEAEMLARWGGDHRYSKEKIAEKIEHIQRHVASLHAVVGKVFMQSEYHSVCNTSNVLKNPPEIDNHILEELDTFGLVTVDNKNFRYFLNEQGTAFVQHMYQKYVVDLQPDEASKQNPRVLVYGQPQPA